MMHFRWRGSTRQISCTDSKISLTQCLSRSQNEFVQLRCRRDFQLSINAPCWLSCRLLPRLRTCDAFDPGHRATWMQHSGDGGSWCGRWSANALARSTRASLLATFPELQVEQCDWCRHTFSLWFPRPEKNSYHLQFQCPLFINLGNL